MKKFLILLMTMGVLVGCQDYITEKREGMKPFHSGEDSKEAQEDN